MRISFNRTNCENVHFHLLDTLSSASLPWSFFATSLADAFILSFLPVGLELIREKILYLVSTDIITTKTTYTDTLSAKTNYH